MIFYARCKLFDGYGDWLAENEEGDKKFVAFS
jgi:hypothetical protein